MNIVDNIQRHRHRRLTEAQWWGKFFTVLAICLVCALIAALIVLGVGVAKADANGPTRHHTAHAMQHVQPGPAPYRKAHMSLAKARKWVKNHPKKRSYLCTSWGMDTPYQRFPSIGFTCKKQAALITVNMVECGGIAGLGALVGGGPEGAAIGFGGCEFSKAMGWWQKKVSKMYRLAPNGRMVRR